MPGEYEVADAAYRRGDYAAALTLLQPLAEAGDARAQTTLGAMHARGHGTPQDEAEAASLFRRAADKGFGPAQFNLGTI